MQDPSLTLIALGLLFLTGLAADAVGRRTHLPRVTLLLGCGIIAGQSGLNIIPDDLQALYPVFSIVALSMVAFLLGSALSFKTLASRGKPILVLSLSIVLTTLLLVAAGLNALGLPMPIALVLGAIATATAPAATYDVIRQIGIDSDFTRTLKGIVAIDDAWGLMVFSLAIVLAQGWTTGAAGFLATSATEILGAIAFGFAIGFPAAFLTGRLSRGEPLRIEALGLTFLTAGLSIWLGLSYLIAGMTVGAVVVNAATHHTRAFHEIENLQWPFMILFFVLAGATLEIEALHEVGIVGIGYVILRTIARLLGGWIGGTLAAVPATERFWYGPALLPQAGVAIGMALIAAEMLPDAGAYIMALTISATVLFEIVGPLAASFAIRRASRAET